MLTGIDHVILAVPDLDAAARLVERELGLSVGAGGRHAAHGTHNRLVWLGDAYIELMGVYDEQLAAGSWWGEVALARVAAGGGVMGIAVASDDLDADVTRLRGQGSPLLEPLAGERARPDGEVVRWRIARLPEVSPELGLVFLIEHDLGSAEWRPADRQARASELHPVGTPARLLRLEVGVADVRRTTQALLHDLGLQFRPSLAGGGARDASIGRQSLRLRPRRGGPAGVPVLGIAAGIEQRSIELLGARWELTPA